MEIIDRPGLAEPPIGRDKLKAGYRRPPIDTKFKVGNQEWRKSPTVGQKWNRLRLDKILQQVVSDDDMAKIMQVQIKLARRGNPKAVKFITEYLVGRAVQTVEANIVTREITPEEQRKLIDEALGITAWKEKQPK